MGPGYQVRGDVLWLFFEMRGQHCWEQEPLGLLIIPPAPGSGPSLRKQASPYCKVKMAEEKERTQAWNQALGLQKLEALIPRAVGGAGGDGEAWLQSLPAAAELPQVSCSSTFLQEAVCSPAGD